MEPYSEVWRSDGNSQALRTFDVPWAICKPFVDWVLGYAVNTVADPGSDTGSGYTRVPFGQETIPYPEGGGYSNLANIFGATAGKLSRIIPSQHPLFPWLYAVECELEHGMGAINSRRDVTVLLNAAGLPFMDWDTGGYARGAAPPIDVDADGEVIRTRARLVTLLNRQTSFTIFPLRGIVNQHPAGEDFFAALGYGAGPVPDAELVFYNQLIDAPSLVGIQNLAQGGNVVAARFLAALTDLELQIVQAQNNIATAVKNAEDVAATRLVVPMIAYVTKPGSALAAPESYSMPPEYTEDGLARFRVTYRPLPYEVRTDRQMAQADWLSKGELERYVQREVNYSLKAFQVPAGQLKFYEGPFVGTAVPAPGSIPFGIQELLYTWHDVPDVPENAIADCEGKVNANAFDGAFGAPTYPAQTLLCQAPKKFRIPRNVRGRVTWRIVYSFLYQPFGWNKFPGGTGGNNFGFYGATIGGAAPAADGSNLIYKLADFASLFTQPVPIDYQVQGRG